MQNPPAEYLKVPKERIAVVIGTKGETKQEIEEKTGTRIDVSSDGGDVEITAKGDDYSGLQKAKNIVHAIARGFSPERAMKLLQPDYLLEMIDLTDYVGKSQSALQERRARLIGSAGRARTRIEQDTNCGISVYGKTVSIIGKQEGMDKARNAVEMLVGGAFHGTVFDRLERKHRERRKFEV